jgi:glycosyltransferase involved in cell wall biosynthesis
VRISYVVPRYGREVVGGAEMAVRMLADRLVADAGWDVEVLTTCAKDSRTWADEYPEGETVEAGVRVRRFASQAGRHPGFDAFSTPVLLGPPPSMEDQRRWVEMQGPVNPAVVKAAASSDAELVVFSPYLYYPIVHGVPLLGERAVVHPAAHDEPALGLPILRDVFEAAGALVFYTHGERKLVGRRFSVAHKPQMVLGLGVDAPAVLPAPGAGAGVGGLGIDEPYLLCVGRVDESKGTGLLARAFATYKERRPGPLKLVFVGQVVDRPMEHPDIVVAGMVDEDVKWGAYAGAVALVQPSPYESFSLVLIEAWLAGAPALVNAGCLATREHCARSGGGLWFGSYGSFEVAVDRLVGDAALRGALAARGRAYAEAEFAWPVLLERYVRFLSSARVRARR